MASLEEIQKERSTLGLLFATVFVIPFQVLLLLLVLILSMNFQTHTIIIGSNATPIFLGYFLMTITYCAMASLFFHPKRIVSPINVQIGVAVTVSIILMYDMARTTNFTSRPEALTFFANLFSSVIVLILLLVAVGMIQFAFVRWVVGLNFDSIDRASFAVEMNPKDLLMTVGDILHDIWGFNRRKDNPKAKTNIIWVLKTRNPYGDSVILTIGSVLGNDNKSILATVAYHASAVGISKSKTASEIRNSIINDIRERLIENKKTLTSIDDVNDYVSVKAYNHALAVTRSKIEITAEFFQSISRYYLYALVITMAAFIAVTVAFAMKALDFGAYISAVVVVILALVIDLGAMLREESSKREIEEID